MIQEDMEFHHAGVSIRSVDLLDDDVIRLYILRITIDMWIWLLLEFLLYIYYAVAS
jgi:hypothetical protein